MGKLLTIETGFTCNSRCQYCTQLDYRAIPQVELLDLPREQIEQRIQWAADNGYDQIGFSGGEPTIRPDFIDLVRFARDLDFERIAVTTNGRMFAYPQFAEQALRAGLDAFTFSLHGPTPGIHDKIAAAPGALAQALAGLGHLQAAAKKLGVRLHLMNNQILLPDNVQYLKEMVDLLAPLGVRLFMVQPFIAQRSNVDELQKFYVPYTEVVAAMERALPALQQWQARIKPYNVPNCLLWPLGKEHVESQTYPITVYREFERERAGEYRAFKARQWYRIDACKTCTELCPGFRIEQYPQEQMIRELMESAEEFAAGPQRDPNAGPLVFSGTELLEPQSLAKAFEVLSDRHGPLTWMTGACERTPRPQLAQLLADAAEKGQLAEVVLVGQPLDQRFLAQRVLEKGNLEEIRQLLYLLAELRQAGRRLPRLRWLTNAGDLLRLLEDPLVAPQWTKVLQALHAAVDLPGDPQAAALLVAIPNFPRERPPPDVARQHAEQLGLAQRLLHAARAAALDLRLVTLGNRRGLDRARARAMALSEQHFLQVLPEEPWAGRWFRHAFSAPELDFVSWSPPWLVERWDLSEQETAKADADIAPVPAAFADGAGEEGYSAVRQVSLQRLAGRDPSAPRRRFGR